MRGQLSNYWREQIGHIPIAFRAKTGVFVPELYRFYLGAVGRAARLQRASLKETPAEREAPN